MPYNQNIPLARDRYLISQGDMLDNFISIDTVTQKNHVVFNDADQGKHKFVQFVPQSNSPTTGGTQVAVYGEENGPFIPSQPFTTPSLVFKRSSGTTINFTNTFVVNEGFGSLPNQLKLYWNRLPSGLLVKIATVFVNVNPNNEILTSPIIELTTGIGPNFNTIYWSNVTPQRDPNIDPNAADADPNVVLYNAGPNLPSAEARFVAWTRNLFGVGRRNPKRDVLIRVVIIGD